MTRNLFMRRIAKAIADCYTPLAVDSRSWKKKNSWLRMAGVNIAREGVAISKGFQCLDGMEEKITIGRYAAIGHNLHLWSFGDIKIGEFCMIAAGVTVSNGWHDSSSFEPTSGPVNIGSGSWLGVNATIVGSVNIGENSIVGAGALVNKDVPPNSIVAGVPARVIGVRNLPERVWHFGNIYFCPRRFEVLQE